MNLSFRQSLIRRIALPIYGLDQLLYVLLIPIIAALFCLLIADFRPIVFMCIFGYIGYVISMFRSSPSSLSIPLSKVADITSWLDNSRYLMNVDANKWIQRKPRILRWNTDTLEIERRDNGAVLYGRYLDLFKAKSLFDESS